MSSTLIYVHGTNGSGKSTLARAVLAAAGGPKAVASLKGIGKATWTTTAQPGRFLVGKYLTACGGVDGILPYALVGNVMAELAYDGLEDTHVFAEGLVTPGGETCAWFASMFSRAVFILLDTPEEQCIQNVIKRRAAAGNTKPYAADNLFKKARSARSWATNLERRGLEVQRLQYQQALQLSLKLMSLPHQP